MTMSARRALIAFCALTTACSSGDTPATAIVIDVGSNLRVPDDVDGLKVVVTSPAGSVSHDAVYPLGASADEYRFPFIFTLVPDGPLDRAVSVEVSALRNDRALFTRAATMTFVRGKSVRLRMRLTSACLMKTCDAQSTCGDDGQCVARQIDPGQLEPYVAMPKADAAAAERDGGAFDLVPAQPADAAAPRDGPAGQVDAAMVSGCGGKTCDSVASCQGGTRCVCPGGYRDERGDGTLCVDIDECGTNRGGCDARTTCTNTAGGRVCGNCPLGFSGTGDTRCEDVNECATNNGGCDVGVKCTNTDGAFQCGQCPPGTVSKGGRCEDVNECATNNGGCDNRTTCTNVMGGRTCGPCPAGFMGTGETGCVDVDECAANNGGCAASATCSNVAGGRTCACKPGYNGDGTTCTSKCTVSNGGCHAEANCTVGPSGVACTCKAGFAGDGTTCVESMRPQVTALTPSDGSTGVPLSPTIVVQFSEPMNRASVESAFSITQENAGAVAGTRSWSGGDTLLQFTPSVPFGYGSRITVQVGTGAKDLVGNALASVATSTFSVLKYTTVTLNANQLWASLRSNGVSSMGLVMVVGDEDASNSGVYAKGFLTFSLSGVPAGAVIRKARLSVQLVNCIGSPFSTWSLTAQHVPFGSSITVEDLSTPQIALNYASETHMLSPSTPTAEAKSTSVMTKVADDLANRTERGHLSQFRLQFGESDNDGISDRCAVDAPGSAKPPTLYLEYEHP